MATCTTVSFVILVFELIQISLCNDPPQGDLPKQGSSADDDDDDSFIKSIWAIFLFAGIGVLILVVLLGICLCYCCRGSKDKDGKSSRRSSKKEEARDEVLSGWQRSAGNDPGKIDREIDDEYSNRRNSPPKSELPIESRFTNASERGSNAGAPVKAKESFRENRQVSEPGDNDPYKYLDKYKSPYTDMPASTAPSGWAAVDKESQSLEPQRQKKVGPPVPPKKRAVLRNDTPYQKVEDTVVISENEGYPVSSPTSPAPSQSYHKPQHQPIFLAPGAYVPAPDYYDDTDNISQPPPKVPAPDYYDDTRKVHQAAPMVPAPDYYDDDIGPRSYSQPPPPPPVMNPGPVPTSPPPPPQHMYQPPHSPGPQSAVRSHTAAVPHRFVRVLPRNPPQQGLSQVNDDEW